MRPRRRAAMRPWAAALSGRRRLAAGDALAGGGDRRQALVERAVRTRFVASALELVGARVGVDGAGVVRPARLAERDVELERADRVAEALDLVHHVELADGRVAVVTGLPL